MNRITKVFFCIISVLIVIVSMCPIPAFAAPDIYFPVASDKPVVNDYSGYVELLYEIKNSGQQFVVVLGWTFTPRLNTSNDFYIVNDKPILTIVRNESQFRLGISTASGCSGYMSFITTYDVASGSDVYFGVMEIPDDEATYYYNFTLGSNYKLVGMHYYGDFQNLQIGNALDNDEFYVVYGSDVVVTYGLNQLISGMYALIEATGQETYKDELDSIISSLNSIDSSVDGFREEYNLHYTQMLSWFRHFLTNLESLVENTDELEGKLDDLYSILENIYFSVFNIEMWMPDIVMLLGDIDSKLLNIIQLLSVKSDIPDEKLTQPDNSDMDNYYEIENGLINGDSADVGNAVNVQINQNAMTVIWNLVERALNSHSKIIGMVLTILSLGIIALILGR